MHLQSIIEKSLLVLAVTLVHVPAAVGDFTVWTIDNQIQDCSPIPTCHPTIGEIWVAGGPNRDNINHGCPDMLNGANNATDADGTPLINAEDVTELVWPEGLCRLTSRFPCEWDQDSEVSFFSGENE
jgi:hypothetical protein